jgi:hypothetical protein
MDQVLDCHGFDEFVEAQCVRFYATKLGRPSLTPGTCFRLLLIGYFEGIDSERGIAWVTARFAGRSRSIRCAPRISSRCSQHLGESHAAPSELKCDSKTAG